MSKLLALLVLSSTIATARADAPRSSRPTVVLVHGAFADGSSWDKVTPLLLEKGYNVVAVHEPLSSLADDVAATKRVIDAQPGKVILVGHSYGGAVITEAGNDEKVEALVYVAAFAPAAGESINDLGKGQPAPPWVAKLAVDSAGFASLPAAVVGTEFAQDLPGRDAQLLASKQGPIAARCFDDKIKTAAWHRKPTWYLRAELDHMIAPAAQELMARRAGAKLTSMKTSHVMMLVKPKDVASTILAAAVASGASS